MVCSRFRRSFGTFGRRDREESFFELGVRERTLLLVTMGRRRGEEGLVDVVQAGETASVRCLARVRVRVRVRVWVQLGQGDSWTVLPVERYEREESERDLDGTRGEPGGAGWR